ncbi:sumo-1 activating enzyme subunit, putative [Entamoeba invadens IP1]|uniref:Sumo-1 activating enzyme subunit, putative n=1 Tax=Entamoeba invadens IP1 TaxID=370355 RepID=A0A0A1TWS9_ENTIV|nr:sumo-1 activating enzyme subunit, putative [Entamoeba invadens IP1]ELP85667.1 sumo-1 activating enzyme subunit, putative [Entamoeba invadens IP1]|eukprot:XP_004185013.1 sumo-1 activating enzyme subunit, putative [Entamoeba invadens IP1]
MNKETAKLYDRSIRTWGVDAQNRILSAHLLIIGYDALMSEILKNVVISGVSKLTVCDTFKSQNVLTTQDDKNHLFSPVIGKDRVDSVNNVNSVNTELKVEIIDESGITEDLLSKVSMVVITSPEEKIISKIETCGNPILFCRSVGYTGVFYLKNVNGHTKNIKDCIVSQYPPLPAREVQRLYYDQFNKQTTYNQYLLFKNVLETSEECLKVYLGVGLDWAPVNSIVGSLAAQEVINVIGGRETYTSKECGAFLYDGVNNIGDVFPTEKAENKTITKVEHKCIDLD